MKHLLSLLFSLLLLGIIFWGCSDQQAPTAGTDNNTPVLMKGGSGGAQIVRYQGETWVWFRDFNAGYTLFLGADMREECNDVYLWDEFNFRDIFLPDTDPEVPRRIVGMTKGDDIRAFVWAWPPQGCDYYTTTDPIAIGTAKVINVDNDVTMWDAPSNNANSYGWSAQGTLEDPEGQVYNLNLHFQSVWKWSWPADGSKDKFVVKINLASRGGN